MYYPIGWHKVLRLDTRCDQDEQPSKILSVQANHERELYFILTSRSIHIWFPRPAAEIVCHRRSSESIAQVGLNKSAVWKTDSSVIVVSTDRDQLLFFQVRKRTIPSSTWSFLSGASGEGNGIYRLKADPKYTKEIRNGSLDANVGEQTPVPALTIFSFGKLDLSSVGVSCLMSVEEELIVGTRNGQIYGIQWDGNVDEKFPWTLSKEVRQRSDFLVDIKFSSVLSGFSLVFRSGRVGYMPLRVDTADGSSDLSNCDTNISYVASIMNALCTEINHRHRLVAFGLKDSTVVICSIAESNLSLVMDHTLQLDSSIIQNNNSDLGRVECLSYSPDNFAIAVTWEGGDIALWSVFGSLLFTSHQWRPECGLSTMIKSARITSLAWGREGYNLWLCTLKDDSDEEELRSNDATIITNGKPMQDGDEISTTSGTTRSETNPSEDIMIMSLARCNLSTSPHQTCSADSLVLVAEEKIYIGPSIPHEDKFDHWIVINIPRNYLDSYYPIRYATVDRNCKNLAIAGNKGMAICSIGTSKWTYFNKKSQEGNLTVCGDMIWWRDYLIISCFNFTNETFELRAYETASANLDNSQAVMQLIPMEIIRMSIFENRLLVLYSDGTLGMFMVNLRRKTATTTAKQLSKGFVIHLAPIENLCIANLQANPFCISSLALTRLHFSNNRSDDSILINSCGKLFLLEREAPPNSSSNVIFKAVSVIATNVEQFWISPEISSASEMSYFKKSLWLSCGDNNTNKGNSSSSSNNNSTTAAGTATTSRLKVWLPLLNDKKDPPNDLYVPERIMLPVKCDIYPLAIRCSSGADLIDPDDAIVLGAESDVLYRDCKLFRYFPYTSVRRQCRVYLHRILRELLLSQHLGYYAKKIAESCQSLPYFAHCFELLLHEVLEEEATSPVPLPDPMLPQVVKFIKEFPVYPETVVHCARKSELSMWSYLFDERAVGSPKRLFQECIKREKFDTAASCLIILQSLDKSTISSRMVKELMRLVKENPKFSYLVDDLESFLARAELEYAGSGGGGGGGSQSTTSGSPRFSPSIL